MADHASMTLSELRALAKEKGINASGKKVDLVARLDDHVKNSSFVPEPADNVAMPADVSKIPAEVTIPLKPSPNPPTLPVEVVEPVEVPRLPVEVIEVIEVVVREPVTLPPIADRRPQTRGKVSVCEIELIDGRVLKYSWVGTDSVATLKEYLHPLAGCPSSLQHVFIDTKTLERGHLIHRDGHGSAPVSDSDKLVAGGKYHMRRRLLKPKKAVLPHDFK